MCSIPLINIGKPRVVKSAKGIKVDPYPEIWIKPQKINIEDTEEVKEIKTFLNDICADKKPYFFKYRYPICEKDYNNFMASKEKWCKGYLGIELKELLNKDNNILTTEEEKFIEDYYNFIPLINYHSPMNKVCEYLEKELSVFKTYKKEKTPEEVINLMQTQEVELDNEIEGALKNYYTNYIDKKRNLKSKQKGLLKPIIQEEDCIVNIEQYAKIIRKRAEDYFANISSQTSLNETIANYVVEYFYKKYPSKSKSFVWTVFGKYLIENIKANTLKTTNVTTIPIKDSQGDIEYLGCNYKEIEVLINNEGEDKDGKTKEV